MYSLSESFLIFCSTGAGMLLQKRFYNLIWNINTSLCSFTLYYHFISVGFCWALSQACILGRNNSLLASQRMRTGASQHLQDNDGSPPPHTLGGTLACLVSQEHFCLLTNLRLPSGNVEFIWLLDVYRFERVKFLQVTWSLNILFRMVILSSVFNLNLSALWPSLPPPPSSLH